MPVSSVNVGVPVTVTASDVVTVMSMTSPAAYVPFAFVDVMFVKVGASESTVIEPVELAFASPLESVNEPAATVIVTEPFAPLAGVYVAVYVVPEPEKFDSEPLPTLTALEPKSVDVRESVKVIVAVCAPLIEIGDAVIVADGKLLSIV